MYKYAISDFNHVIEINPMSAESYNALGVVYYCEKEYEKAIYNFNQALKINPHFLDSYNNIIVVYFKKKDYDNLNKMLSKMRELGYKIPPQLSDYYKK